MDIYTKLNLKSQHFICKLKKHRMRNLHFNKPLITASEDGKKTDGAKQVRIKLNYI